MKFPVFCIARMDGHIDDNLSEYTASHPRGQLLSSSLPLERLTLAATALYALSMLQSGLWYIRQTVCVKVSASHRDVAVMMCLLTRHVRHHETKEPLTNYACRWSPLLGVVQVLGSYLGFRHRVPWLLFHVLFFNHFKQMLFGNSY